MADKILTDNLKNYFKKLRRLISMEADFSIFGYKFVKKVKVDDILCCIISSFPEIYKKAIPDKNQQLTSILAYNILTPYLKNKFFLNSEFYMIQEAESVKYIDAIVQTIEKDIELLEKHASE